MNRIKLFVSIFIFSLMAISLMSQPLTSNSKPEEGGGTGHGCQECVSLDLFFVTTKKIPSDLLNQIEITASSSHSVNISRNQISLFSEMEDPATGCVRYRYDVRVTVCVNSIECENFINILIEYGLTINGQCLADVFPPDYFDPNCILVEEGCEFLAFYPRMCCDVFAEEPESSEGDTTPVPYETSINQRNSDYSIENISINPNPFNHKINLLNLKNGDKLMLFNSAGQKVLERDFISSDYITLDAKGLNSGFYILQCIRNENIILVRKIVKL